MASDDHRNPVLLDIYHRYLDDEHTPRFVTTVARRYTVATLERLGRGGDRGTRRAAVMALGFLGDYRSNPVIGRALSDSDRGVRLLAESSIRQIWLRLGTIEQQSKLVALQRANEEACFGRARQLASELLDEAHWLAEAWHQRGVALWQQESLEEAASDFRETLARNTFHFPAAVGLGQCYLALDKPFSALESFRHGLAVCPDMEAVRAQVRFLERVLKEG